MIRPQTTPEAHRLFLDGSLALAEMEHNGFRIDMPYLDKAIDATAKKIKSMEQELREDKDVFPVWNRVYGGKLNFGARDQLAKVLFGEMKYSSRGTTKAGRRESTSKKTLELIDQPFVKKYIKLEEYTKARSTYLVGLKRECVERNNCWWVHPSFNLNTVISMRSSCNKPNVQNQPKRNPDITEIVRKCFIARKGMHFVEPDFSMHEVRIGGIITKDKELRRYIFDPKSDMHRDMSKELFLIDEVPKDVRSWVKNDGVFATFYGSAAVNVARNLWDDIDLFKLKTVKGVPLKKHLATKGIRELGDCEYGGEPGPHTFAHHTKKWQAKLWQRFKGYDDWRTKTYEKYQRDGYIKTQTGFVIDAVVGKNEVCNYDIQGCLAGNSKVLTKKGLIPIKELVDKQVEVWTGFRWANAVGLNRGSCQRVIVQLSSGLTIRCDTRHKFKNEKNEWIDFTDLKIGNYVALPSIPDMVEPSEDITWSFILGFIIGDGCISNRKRRNLSIIVGTKKKDILLAIKAAFMQQGFTEDVYGGLHWKVIPAKDGKQEKYQLSIQSSRLASLLEQSGLRFGSTAHTKRIPASIWKASQQDQRDFLEGLWLSDGNRGAGQERNIHTPNKRLLREVQVLSASVGFDSSLAKTPTGWLLKMSCRRFNSKTTRRMPAYSLLRQVREVVSTNYEDRCQYITDRRNLSLAKKGVEVTQYVAERILHLNSKTPICYRYDTVKEIKILDYKEDTYTMSVDDDLHQFVADGVIHKNSAFHCLVWAMIRIIRKLKKYKMKSVLIAEIHDSLPANSPPSELNDFLDICRETMTVELPKAWKWLTIPLEMSVEMADVGKSWFDLKEI